MYRSFRNYDNDALEMRKKNLEADIEDLEEALKLIPASSILGTLGVNAALSSKRKKLNEVIEEQEYRIFKERAQKNK